MRRLLLLMMWAGVGVNCALAQTEFRLPVIPDSVTEPKGRLAYTLNHFWDAYAFADTTEVNQALGEQGFVDFVSLIPFADSLRADDAVGAFVDKAFATEWGSRHYADLVEHYLGNPYSPLRNDKVYAHLLRHMQRAYGPAQEAAALRCGYRLELIAKNQVGTKAHDFAYEDRNGAATTLYETEAEYTLLYFNDPDCETCQQQMPQAMAEAWLQDRRLVVLAVYPGVDTPTWKDTERSMPENWRDVCSPKGEIMTEQTYYLPALPSLYLLDSEKRVVLKDATLKQVVDYLKRRAFSGNASQASGE